MTNPSMVAEALTRIGCGIASFCMALTILTCPTYARFIVIPEGGTFIEGESAGGIRQGSVEQTLLGAGVVGGFYGSGEPAPAADAWRQVEPYNSTLDPFGFMSWSDGRNGPGDGMSSGPCAGCDPVAFPGQSTIVYNFSQSATFEELVIWNANGISWNQRGWDTVEILPSTDGGTSFGAAVTVGGNAAATVGDYSGDTTQDAIVLTFDSPVAADAFKLVGLSGQSHPKITALAFVADAPIPGTELLLQIDPTGAGRMINFSETAIDIDFYQIESEAGLLDSDGWTSLDSQEGDDPPGTGWVEAGGSNANILGEGRLEGMLSIAAEGGETRLGTLFDVNHPMAGDPDLLFSVGLLGAGQVFGAVEFVAEAFPDLGLNGDFNGDGVVNIADYTVWRDNLGATEDGSVINGNGNGGVVDATDYSLWKSSFGNTASPVLVATNAQHIPEPGAVVIALGIVCLAILQRDALAQ